MPEASSPAALVFEIRKNILAISQEEMADLLGCDVKTVRNHEKGKTEMALEDVADLRALPSSAKARGLFAELPADRVERFSAAIARLEELLSDASQALPARAWEPWEAPAAAVDDAAPSPPFEPRRKVRLPPRSASPLAPVRVRRLPVWLTLPASAISLSGQGVATVAFVALAASCIALGRHSTEPPPPTSYYSAGLARDAVSHAPPRSEPPKRFRLGAFARGAHQVRPVPDKPFRGQERSPCRPGIGHAEINGGCWGGGRQAPCNPEDEFEFDGKCWQPIQAEPDKPVMIDPVQ